MEAFNPTNLDLSFTLPVVQGFDYAGLKAWAEGIKAKYAEVVVMEDQIIGTKAEMAELNRIKKQLDAARIAAVKKVSEPVRTSGAAGESLEDIRADLGDCTRCKLHPGRTNPPRHRGPPAGRRDRHMRQTDPAARGWPRWNALRIAWDLC